MTDRENRKIRPAGVRFAHVSVLRDGRAILEDICAEAPAGGATVIIGPNGAGKTTLLRCLLGEMPCEGSITFMGKDGTPLRAPAIGYVPQQLFADPQSPLRVFEFLALGLESRPLWLGCSRKVRARCRRLLEMVGAEGLEGQRLGDLSGGETRRVLLASALGRKPDLLVLDEAEAGVDYKGERVFWELLDQSRRELGFTLLMVSHNLPLAAHYSTHVICVKTEMLAQGAPRLTLTSENLQTLFGAPIHLYPSQCDVAGLPCPDCGALGNLPHLKIPGGVPAPKNTGGTSTFRV